MVHKSLCMILICLAILGLISVVLISYKEHFIATRQPTYNIPEDSLPTDYNTTRESIPNEDQAQPTGEPVVAPQDCNPTQLNTSVNQENIIYTRGMNNFVDFTSNSK